MIANLDPILTAAAPGSVIELEHGLYTTMGVTDPQATALTGPVLKKGITLRGHALGTTILCVRAPDGPEVTPLFGGEGDVTIENLTVDCGPSGDSPKNKRNGGYFRGKNNTVRNVHVVRAWGALATMRESFGISVLAMKDANNLIENCSVREIQGDYQTAIQGWKLRGCEVEFPRNTARAFRVAYNAGESDGASVEECSSRWAYVGIYWDWENCLDLTVKDCSFLGCIHGLHLNAQQMAIDTVSRCARNLKFWDNDILLSGDQSGVAAFAIVHSTPEGIYTKDNTLHSVCGVEIVSNRVRMMPGARSDATRYLINASSFLAVASRSEVLGVTGVRLVDNDVTDADLLTCRNWRGNADVSGTVKRVMEFSVL